jgi:hypothetical protein
MWWIPVAVASPLPVAVDVRDERPAEERERTQIRRVNLHLGVVGWKQVRGTARAAEVDDLALADALEQRLVQAVAAAGADRLAGWRVDVVLEHGVATRTVHLEEWMHVTVLPPFGACGAWLAIGVPSPVPFQEALVRRASEQRGDIEVQAVARVTITDPAGQASTFTEDASDLYGRAVEDETKQVFGAVPIGPKAAQCKKERYDDEGARTRWVKRDQELLDDALGEATDALAGKILARVLASGSAP